MHTNGDVSVQTAQGKSMTVFAYGAQVERISEQS